jgi:hypothetical protein
MDLPIVCTLSEAELQERRHKLLDSIQAKTVETLALSNGYAYKFKGSPEILATLAQLIALERQCCRFLTFKLIAEAGTEDVDLEITGPSDAKALIADFFGAS